MKTIKLQDQVLCPSKIVCIGRNYAAHIDELKNETPSEPVIFIKPNSSISKEIYFNQRDPVDYEGELVFLIIKGEIAGVGSGLDLTKRQLQARLKEKGLPWERAKAFDNSAVLSPFVNFDGDLSTLSIQLFLNDELVQSAGYDLMLNKPEDILLEIKGFLTLEDGDLIMTGTPKGVGKIQPGDRFLAKVFSDDTLLQETTWTVQD